MLCLISWVSFCDIEMALSTLLLSFILLMDICFAFFCWKEDENEQEDDADYVEDDYDEEEDLEDMFENMKGDKVWTNTAEDDGKVIITRLLLSCVAMWLYSHITQGWRGWKKWWWFKGLGGTE